MQQWTDPQRQAIKARNKEVLVSAAAGSGKTTVLIHRVLSLLKEGMPLDRMLVITFTHAAADEMRERLTDLLSIEAQDDPGLRQQYALLGRADISTLHSFCQKIVKRHFQAADTDPLSKLADEPLAAELFSNALSEAMDRLYAQPDAEEQALIDRFRDEQISSMAGTLYRFLMAQAEPWGWLDRSLKEQEGLNLYGHPWYQVMRRKALLTLSGAEETLQTCLLLCGRPDGPARYYSAITDDLTMVGILSRDLEADRHISWSGPDFTRLPTKKAPSEENPEVKEKVRTLRDKAKELIRKALSLLPSGEKQAKDWTREMHDSLPPLRALARLAADTHARYQEAKATRALWDFNDLEHLALRALKDEAVSAEVSGAFDALFVDEYQDISHIQEAIIMGLQSGKSTLFMVGDVKQSIYRFRLADPTLFLDKFKRFDREEGAEARLILLRENFRSRPSILKAVNLVFQHAMRSGATELDYDEQARLSALPGAEEGPPVELWLLEKGSEALAAEDEEIDIAPSDKVPGEETEEEEEKAPRKDGGEMEKAHIYEARLIAWRIKELLETSIPDRDGQRKLRLKDIAILLRTASGRASAIAEVLSEEGIAAYSDADGEFFTQPEVRDAVSLLKTLDNPYDDTVLLSALACPAFSFSPEDLARVRAHDRKSETPWHRAFFSLAETDEQCRKAVDTLSRWRFLADNMPLDRFIRLLLRESGLYAVAGASRDGAMRRANLRMLAARAALSPRPMTLASFIKRVNSTIRQKVRDRSAALGAQDDVVRIMTLHKSKGLEFPVVFMPDLAAGFANKRPSQSLCLDAQTGLALDLVDPALRLKHTTFGVRAIQVKRNREELSEEARLLYVGMTRAKERLILIGAPSRMETAAARWSRPLSVFQAGNATCMLDWIGPLLYPWLIEKRETICLPEGGSKWRLAFCATGSLPPANESRKPANPEEEGQGNSSAFSAAFAPASQEDAFPLKSSVTALISGRSGLFPEEEEETPALKRKELSPLRPVKPLPRLSGVLPLTGAQRGAAAHKTLCALDPADFVYLSGRELIQALERAADGLLERGLLLKEERQALDLDAAAGFYTSSLAGRMAESPEKHAEWPFTMRVEGGMILQGVLDACFLEDGAWVLVDYKTDQGEPEELADRYRDQMRWYMRALREITGQPVKEAWLYLLRRNLPVEVREGRPIRLAGQDREAAGSL